MHEVTLTRCFCAIFIWIILPGVVSTCEFPEFLRQPFPGGGERYWLTETRFDQTMPSWEKRLQITVHSSQIVAKVSQEGTCRRHGGVGGPVACPRNELKYTLTCEEEKDGKFKVRKSDQNGGHAYLCYDFKKRNKNVVQVWKSKHTTDTALLCKSFTMVRDEWVWVAPHLEEWVPCPLNGGYDFVTYDVQQHDYFNDVLDEAYCEDSDRPSRLESECIKGEGLQFLFPEAGCSPFPDKKEYVQLYCWAYWTEDLKTFVIMSEADSTPQFVLRYSGAPERGVETTAYFYFSPVIPLSHNGLLSDGVADKLYTVKMMITPSDPGDGICYDETTRCSDSTHQNTCGKTEIFQSNYCKKTCGLCNLLPNSLTECHFPGDLKGSWLYFINGEPETVTIQDGRMHFSSLGKFICKGVNSPDTDFIRQYKVFSYYHNGCRPRYSCIELGQSEAEIYQFRLSPSQPKDESFRLCRFRDDPGPMNGAVRSLKKKNLLQASETVFNSCALYGEVPVAKDHTNDQCYGSLSDWNRHQCELDNVLRVSLDGRCDKYGGHSSVYRELTCLAFSSVQPDSSLLFTREIANDNQFTCWIVRTYAESMSYRPWRLLHQLNTTDCNSVDLFTSMLGANNLLDLKIMNDRRKPNSASDPPFNTDCETDTPQYSVRSQTPDTKSLYVYSVSSTNNLCTLHVLGWPFTVVLSVFILFNPVCLR